MQVLSSLENSVVKVPEIMHPELTILFLQMDLPGIIAVFLLKAFSKKYLFRRLALKE